MRRRRMGDEKNRVRWDWKRKTWRAVFSAYSWLLRCQRCGAEHWGGARARLCHECGRLRYEALVRERRLAAAAVARARRHGELVPPSDFACMDCGTQAQVYDHRDYSRPLDVQPVCLKCNSRRGPGRRLAFDSNPEWRDFPAGHLRDAGRIILPSVTGSPS